MDKIYNISFLDTSEAEDSEFATYLGLTLTSDEYTKEFKSGDFIKDWYNVMKTITNLSEGKFLPMFTISSQINHLSDYGFSYESGYLHEIGEDSFELKYFDRTNPNWWLDSENIEKGLEFFVPDNTWSWKKLKEYCSHI